MSDIINMHWMNFRFNRFVKPFLKMQLVRYTFY